MRRALGAALVFGLGLSLSLTPVEANAVGTVTGTVVDENGRAINGLDVYLYSRVTTDARGRFSIPRVPAGTWSASFFDNRYQQFFFTNHLSVVVPASGKNLGTIVLKSTPRPARSPQALDTSNKEAVRGAFRQQVVASLRDEVNLRPDGCRVPPTPYDAQRRTINAVNFMRRISGLDPVALDSTLSAHAQKAALIMHRQGFMDHSPSPSAPCWTRTGARAAARSNLAQGYEAARAVLVYMQDFGSYNTSVGHRRWITDPYTETMGHGQVGSYEALYHLARHSRANPAPRHLSWPTAGYFPQQLEPTGRWSFSVVRRDVSFAGARVTVTRAGQPLALIRHGATGYLGDQQTLVWDFASPRVVSRGGDFTVTVAGVTQRGVTLPPYRYVVRLFTA